MAKRAQKWKDEIVLVFCEVLADPENGFANALEMLALKKSANTEVFGEIKYEFDKKLRENELENVDTEIPKLRRKYALLKSTWRSLHDRIKRGTGKGAKGYPKWYHVINPVFSETNAEVALSESSKDMSFHLDNHDHVGTRDSEEESRSDTDNEGENEQVDTHGEESDDDTAGNEINLFDTYYPKTTYPLLNPDTLVSFFYCLKVLP